MRSKSRPVRRTQIACVPLRTHAEHRCSWRETEWRGELSHRLLSLRESVRLSSDGPAPRDGSPSQSREEVPWPPTSSDLLRTSGRRPPCTPPPPACAAAKLRSAQIRRRSSKPRHASFLRQPTLRSSLN